MATITEIQRKVMFNSNQLEDIKQLSIEELKNHYSALYPELINAEVRNLGVDNEGYLTYEFQNKAGTKG